MFSNLRTQLYSTNRLETLGQKIDRAYAIYNHENESEKNKKIAQEFLIYAFDIQEPSNLSAQLKDLMHERNLHKEKNPEYIPGLSPRYLNLAPKDRSLQKSEMQILIKDQQIQNLLTLSELIDVTDEDKLKDVAYETKFLTSRTRAKYRVHLFKGQFYKDGKLFDTTDYIAHRKHAYAAYTLNANGELSVFNHHGSEEELKHSYINASCPLVSAGELIIKKGNLLAINTYSGHYKPSLFNVYRVLEYFTDKGVKLINTKIYTKHNPNQFGLNDLKVQQVNVHQVKYYYEIYATELLAKFELLLHEALTNIDNDITEYKKSPLTSLFVLKDKLSRSERLTEKRIEQAEFFNVTVADFQQDLLSQAPADLNHLKNDLNTIYQKNSALSEENGKEKTNGRLYTIFFKAINNLEITPPSARTELDLVKMKKIH